MHRVDPVGLGRIQVTDKDRIRRITDIDELDDLIKGIDKKVLGNIDGINTLYQEVARAYENQISIGCSSGLIWVDAGISTSGAGT